MAKISLIELSRYLNQLLQPGVPVSDYCFNGVQVQGCSEIKTIATAVSASLETMQTAAKQGVQALIVHHGLFWAGDSYVIDGAKREKLRLLLENEISLIAYHLPLDMHQLYGNNWKAARDMGWKDLEPFGLYKGSAIGVRGKVDPISREHLQQKLEKYYQHPATIAFGGKKEIATIALISGGAHKSLPDAAAADIDAFITGSFDEPTWNQAYEESINFYALGHTATERIGPKALGEHLQQVFHVNQTFIDTPNPF